MNTCVRCGRNTESEVEFKSQYYDVPSGIVCSQRCLNELEHRHDIEEKRWDKTMEVRYNNWG